MNLLKKINYEKIVGYIEQLVNIPSPTGYTAEIRDFLISFAQNHQINYKVTKKGAVIFSFGPAIPGTVFAAHIDTLGAMVSSVSEKRVKITPMGGFPAIYIIGERCTVHSRSGKVYAGTFLPDDPAVHVNSKLKDMKPDFDNCSIRMDIEIKDEKKMSDLINVGDFVSFDAGFRTVGGFVNSRHLDDKASAGIFLHLSTLMKDLEKHLDQRVSFFFNITEETGQGLAGMPDTDDLIVVDMGVVGAEPAGSEKCVSICAKDSSGPYNYDLTNDLIETAKKFEIDYKIDVFPYYGSDGSALLRSCSDSRVALIGQGVDASHGYERTHVSGLHATASLVMAYIFKDKVSV